MDPTQPTKKLENLDQTGPNPWVNPTHGQLYYGIFSNEHKPLSRFFDAVGWISEAFHIAYCFFVYLLIKYILQ